jgi:alanyl-tRNA synthetase
MSVDEDGFSAAMERQRTDARAAWAGSGDSATEEIWFTISEAHGATEFLGYETESAEGQILAIVVDGEQVNTAVDGVQASVIVNQTPFYGEAGGQMGDSGEIRFGDVLLCVECAQKKLGVLHIHTGMISGGFLEVGNEVTLKVNHQRRSGLRANHSATHLLHEALRRKLGDHVTQKGSLVAPDRLRFDIAHPKTVSLDEMSYVEAQVNDVIRANNSVSTLLMTPDEAIKAGAMALFGEKYGDEVRVVSMGDGFSTELCGGTHVERTGDIGLIKILGESAVAAGVRRIEALTGKVALEYLEGQDTALLKVAAILKSQPNEVTGRVQVLIDERKKMERELADLRKKLAATGGGGDTAPATKDIGGIPFASRLINDMPAKDLKGLADEVKGQIGSGVVALVSVADGKVSLVVAVSEDLNDKVNAVDLVRVGSAAVGGKGGGGRRDMAQAGGPDVQYASAALEAMEKALSG